MVPGEVHDGFQYGPEQEGEIGATRFGGFGGVAVLVHGWLFLFTREIWRSSPPNTLFSL